MTTKDLLATMASFNALTNGQTLHDILEKTLLFLSDDTHWCQGAQALNSNCQKVRINSPDAVAWSIEGAVGKCSNDEGIIPTFILLYLDQVVLELFGNDEGVGWFNDSHTHEYVLMFLQQALRQCKDAQEQIRVQIQSDLR